MDYEKAYKEAFERAKILYNDKNEIGYANAESVLEEVFPLLKESEDEMVRNCLINGMKFYYEDNEEATWGTEKFSMKVKDILAWLEKQAEQKLPIEKLPSEMKTIGESLGFTTQKECDKYNQMVSDLIMSDDDKVKPKFKPGDWVVSPNGVYWHIDAIQNGRYEVTADTGQCGNWPLDTNIYRLWTIQDAKPGDVLTNGDFPCIFKRCDGNGSLYVYCGINAYNDFSILSEDSENVWDDYSKQYFPATKEQRDLLFQKMKEAGYEWSEETHELKKISQRTISAEAKEAMYDKPAAWSVEDEEFLRRATNAAKDVYPMTANWLKKLKQRCTWKPSDEQVKQLGWIAEQNKDNMIGKELISLYQDLKKLRGE